MPSVIEELERKKVADAERSTGDSTTGENTAAEQEESEGQVQTGTVSDADRGKLLEDVGAGTKSSGGGRFQEYMKNYLEAANKKFVSQRAPITEIPAGNTARLREKFQEAGNKKFVQPPTTTSVTVKKEDDKKKPVISDSISKEDKYALLKKDPSSLLDEEKELRIKLLIEKYVHDWKKEKEEQEKELSEDLNAGGKSSEKTEKTDQPAEASAQEKEAGKAAKTKETEDELFEAGESSATETGTKDEEDAGTKIKQLIGGAWSFVSSRLGTFQSGQQATENTGGASSSPFGFVRSLFAKFAGKGTDDAEAGPEQSTSASGAAGNDLGLANLGRSLIDMAKGVKESYSYGKLAGRKQTGESKAQTANQYINARERYKQLKEAYKKGGVGALSKEERMEMLKQRRTRKRSQDFLEAMAAAQEHAKIKSRAGIGRAVGSGLGSLGGVLNLAGSLVKKFAGPKGQLAGTILGALGGGLAMFSPKVGEFLSKKFGTDKAKATNEEKGKKYLEEKAAKLMGKPEAQADHVNEEEAKLIVARRLGVKDPSDYAAVYKKLAERRAERILKKEEGYQEVLAAMGLPEDADKASILEALGVS